MPQYNGRIAGITRTGAGYTGGITGAATYTISDIAEKGVARTALWEGAVFGISVTTIGTQSFSVYVVGDLGGIQVPIAGLSGIATTASTLLPIVNEVKVATVAGTTQYAVVGIPTPRSVIFGNSATPGQSYSAIVYATLYKAK